MLRLKKKKHLGMFMVICNKNKAMKKAKIKCSNYHFKKENLTKKSCEKDTIKLEKAMWVASLVLYN